MTRANRPLSSCAVGPCGASPRQRASRRAATVRRRRGLVWVVVWWLTPSQPSRRPTACRANRSPLVLVRSSLRSARWSEPPPPPRAGAASEATRATGGRSRAHGWSTRGAFEDSARGLPARSQGPVARVRAASRLPLDLTVPCVVSSLLPSLLRALLPPALRTGAASEAPRASSP